MASPIPSFVRFNSFAPALLTAIATILLSGCGNDIETVVTAPGIPQGTLATVDATASEVAIEINFDGVIEAVNQARVSSQTNGRVVSLPYDVGDYVRKGDVIAVMTDTEQQASLQAAKAQLSEAQAKLSEAKAQFVRITDVYAKGMVAEASYDQAKAAELSAQARAASAEAAVKDAEQRLAYTRVIAPYDGIVVKRLTEVGAAVAPGTPLMEGLSLEHLRVQVNIPQQYIGHLRQHKMARVILPSGESIAVDEMRMPPSADANTHSFTVLLQLPSIELSEPVFPGTLVKVAVVSGRETLTQIPDSAVAYRGEVAGVYVLSDNLDNADSADQRERVEFRYLRIGRATAEGQRQILSGVNVGERVALDPVLAASAYKQQFKIAN
ncbi:efflux RND transporter periplasmic adaptor subunit [Teredinibacter waterburyi]|uniref:efflux RND transporter periplasmic adaptor subunit n=1 Tax=Teredinibacter waterburyi TaxID=1500538 RepID=UPI001FE817F1|nr:efflux RND transporter periplasmic adaptor subunit [Teredinibacter waterburyi]